MPAPSKDRTERGRPLSCSVRAPRNGSGTFTGVPIGDRLAIVLDRNVITAPSIKGQISDNGVIENVGTQEEASDLALNLRAGSLPASVVYMQESTVGPSLGNDSIRDGFTAGIAGVMAVMVAMLVYYKRSGINAVLGADSERRHSDRLPQLL